MVETDHAATVVPLRRLRRWLWFWRIGVVLALAVLGFFWIQSQSRIHQRLIPVGIGGVDLCVAGSSAAVSIMGEAISSVHFGDALGPPDSESLLHYEARWKDGKPFGRVASECLFPPAVGSLERVDLDRTGSFSFMFTEIPSPAGGARYSHFRFPFWFLMALVIGGWIWLERFSARQRRRASLAD